MASAGVTPGLDDVAPVDRAAAVLVRDKVAVLLAPPAAFPAAHHRRSRSTRSRRPPLLRWLRGLESGPAPDTPQLRVGPEDSERHYL